jgi:hypothetical protein
MTLNLKIHSLFCEINYKMFYRIYLILVTKLGCYLLEVFLYLINTNNIEISKSGSIRNLSI